MNDLIDLKALLIELENRTDILINNIEILKRAIEKGFNCNINEFLKNEEVNNGKSKRKQREKEYNE